MFQPIDNPLLPDEPAVLAVGFDAATCEILKTALRQVTFAVERYASIEALFEAWEFTRRGCVFLDLHCVGLGPQEAVRRLARGGICLPVILLVPRGKTADGDVAATKRTIRAGAFDSLPEPWLPELLAAAAREALHWEVEHHAQIVERAVIERRLARLDVKEEQILGLIVQGMSSKAIAPYLAVSIRTVEARRKSLMVKMRAKSQIDLLRQAITAGVGTQ